MEENLLLVKKVWEPVIRLAEENGVKIAIENCPMLFGPDQWPGGQNLMTTPDSVEKSFLETWTATVWVLITTRRIL